LYTFASCCSMRLLCFLLMRVTLSLAAEGRGGEIATGAHRVSGGTFSLLARGAPAMTYIACLMVSWPSGVYGRFELITRRTVNALTAAAAAHVPLLLAGRQASPLCAIAYTSAGQASAQNDGFYCAQRAIYVATYCLFIHFAAATFLCGLDGDAALRLGRGDGERAWRLCARSGDVQVTATGIVGCDMATARRVALRGRSASSFFVWQHYRANAFIIQLDGWRCDAITITATACYATLLLLRIPAIHNSAFGVLRGRGGGCGGATRCCSKTNTSYLPSQPAAFLFHHIHACPFLSAHPFIHRSSSYSLFCCRVEQAT